VRQRRPPRGRQKRPSRSARARKPAQAVKQAERRIEITLPSREVEPARVVAHLGPTNSGKTHAALEELAAAGRGVYAGPLRMLAQEAHRRLGERMGAENVGLVTG
jgi:ATP-dependent RNA helicase SUPV3L1/SUV3